MNRRNMSFMGGFTLMELLVVIAIIALLVSILMPSLQAAKSLARTAVCQANVNRLAIGNGMYMGDYDGFSVHGREWANAWVQGTGYGLCMIPTEEFDDDYGNTKPGVLPANKNDRGNWWLGGAQNICGLGQLMWDRYIDESAESVGCPQADFVEVTPFTGYTGSGSHSGENFQYVKKMMAYPKLDPNKTYSGSDPNFTDPNAYWRNEFYNGNPDYFWRNNRWISNYVVRGPMFKSGDILNLSGESYISFLAPFPANARPKADSQVAIFADHEWADYKLGDIEAAGALPMLGYDKPAWKYFPRRHISGPVVAYTDGHAAMFQDESRQKTWNHTGKNAANYTNDYGNGWAMFAHVFDEE